MTQMTDEIMEKAGLSDYEKQLVKLIDEEEKGVTEVAKMLHKDKSTVSPQHKSTVSPQHKRALEKVRSVQNEERQSSQEGKRGVHCPAEQLDSGAEFQ